MKYCINGRFLTQRLTGVQRFAYVLVCALKVKYPELQVLVPAGDYKKLPFEVVSVGNRQGVLWEHTDLPIHLKKNGNPILVNLCNVGPLFYKRNVITLHDIAFKINPGWFSRSFSAFYNFIIPQLLKRALRVITVSEFSKGEIESEYKIKGDDISIVSNVNRIRQRKKTDKESFLLFVGSFNPRKNLEMLVNAFSLIETDFKLKIVGAGESSFSGVKRDAKKDNIEYLGYLNDDELDMLYQKASGFISLSFYEGFNIPVLEALASGCNVLLSDIPVHQELYKDVAIFVDHTDILEVQIKLKELIEKKVNTDLNSEFVAQYTIDKAVGQFEKVLEEVI